jgi:uncharacterized phage protein (TIGR02218 family)
MKTLPPAFAAHLASETATLATCWKITRRDGHILGFTNHDADLVIDAQLYQASSGFTATAVATSATLSADDLDVEGVLDAEAISEADLMAGLYDYAEVEVFEVNYTDPAQGRLPLTFGWLGEVSVRDGRFVAEIRSLSQRLQQRIGELYSPTCRASLGDSRCKVNMASRRFSGSVTGAPSRHELTDTARSEPAGRFAYGKLTFTSGANNGLSMEVREYTPGKITLALPMPHPCSIGDTYLIEEGCDRLFSTCINRFANAVNFRGEPHVPGLDRMLETSATRSTW